LVSDLPDLALIPIETAVGDGLCAAGPLSKKRTACRV